jgi:hypothetical protein
MEATEFWNWFTQNQNKYLFINQVDSDMKEQLLNEFLLELHHFCDKLYFEIGGHPDGIQDLIITAEGNTDFFDKVEELISCAPQMNNWKPIAFKPPMGIGFTITYADITANSNDLWFDPLEYENEPNSLGIQVFFPNYKKKREKEFRLLAFQLIDTLIGEKSAALDIDFLEVEKIPKNPVTEGLIRLNKLEEFIKWNKLNKDTN